VAYSNIARLKPGDTLLLNDQHRYTIIDVRRYSDFDALVEAEDPATIAPDLVGREALLAACRAIYPSEKEALGVVALEIAQQVESSWVVLTFELAPERHHQTLRWSLRGQGQNVNTA
jgi:ASC-1-like (ASCH) protein